MTHLLFHKTPNSVSSEPGAAHDVANKAEMINLTTAKDFWPANESILEPERDQLRKSFRAVPD
jgi:hypothetical protein